MIKDEDFIAASKKIGCKPSRLKAFYKVEANSSGYLDDGAVPGEWDNQDRLKILFEGHRFWKQLVKNNISPLAVLKNFPQYSDILYRKFDRSKYKGGAAEWTRWSRAIELCGLIKADASLAMNSASYGAFQIMGENYALCGYKSAQEMITSYNNKGEAEHLNSCIEFLKNTNLINALIKGDWDTVAERYNGTAYRINRYHIKLQLADKLCSSLNNI